MVAPSPVAAATSGPDDTGPSIPRVAISLQFAVWAGRVLLLGQLAWLIAFSTVEYQRGRLTYDFSAFDQASWLISHGHLNAFDTPAFLPFWQLNANWLMWPLAALTRLPPHDLWLLWAQDLAIFGCGWVALHWIAEVVAGPSWRSRLWPPAAVGLVVLLFVINPWIYMAAAYDFHFEAITGLFLMLAAWDLSRRKTRRMWTWIVLALASHAVAAVYVVGIGLAGLVTRSRSTRRASILVVAAGLAWFGLVSLVQADRGSPLVQGYGYLAGAGAHHPSVGQMAWGALVHPSRPFAQLWSNRINLWANLSPSGLLGVANPWGLAATLVVLVPDSLFGGHAFALPSFQNFVAFPFVTVGSVLVLGWLGTRKAWVGHTVRPLALAMAVLAVAWAWVYLPTYPDLYLGVTPSGARALAAARAMIPPGAEVVASNVVSGRFAGRPQIYVPMSFQEVIPVHNRPVYFVISTKPAYRPLDTQALLGQVAGLGARLLLRESGIWVFRWDAPAGQHSLVIAGAQGGVPAWALRSSAGRTISNGPPASWRIQGNRARGLVLWGDYWRQGPGPYLASADMVVRGPAVVQVVARGTRQVLASVQVVGNGARQKIELPFLQPESLPMHGGRSGLVGQGILEVQSQPTAAVQTVEVEIFNPGTSAITAYAVGVRPLFDQVVPTWEVRGPPNWEHDPFQ